MFEWAGQTSASNIGSQCSAQRVTKVSLFQVAKVPMNTYDYTLRVQIRAPNSHLLTAPEISLQLSSFFSFECKHNIICTHIDKILVLNFGGKFELSHFQLILILKLTNYAMIKRYSQKLAYNNDVRGS